VPYQQAYAMKHLPLDLEALLRVPYVEPEMGFALSPDGTQIAFSWNPTGQWEIYVAPFPDATSPQQITTGPGAKFAPRWSPDGQSLAYVLDLDGGELYDIFRHDFATGLHTNLTPDTPDAIQSSFSWSPDGDWIAYLSDRAGRFDTYVMAAMGGHHRRVLSTPYPDWEVEWSPDGEFLAVVAEARGQDYWTFMVPVQGGEPAYDDLEEVRIVSDGAGPICAKDARWSPDSARLLFASNARGQFDIGACETATGRISWLTEGEGDKELPAWAPDGRRLAYVVSHGPVTSLVVHKLEGGDSTTYQVAPGVHYRPSFTPDSAYLVVVFDNPAYPCDLWSLPLAGGSFQQLTDSLPRELNGASFSMPDHVRYPSLDEQVLVPALLYQPPAADRLPPAVIYIHGGPNWLAQVTWDPLVQHMVSRGWVVLAPNYRGSTGYGREWQLASRFDFGGSDARDVVAGADFLVERGLADPAHLAVTGRSWGGYLTMMCLTHYPGRWAGGSAVVPFLNWFTGHANSREDLQHWDLENFGHPEKDQDLYYERSPFFFLDRITAPVQLICGAHDVRCPPGESTQARDRLLGLGKTCEYVLYPDEGHSFLNTENVIDVKRRRAAFLARVLEAGRGAS
jgi:dipeptidyl aminopeptidase/acylaminoacyl peptidase